MSAALTDLRHAVRGLRTSPGFAVAAVLCLALGLGVNGATFQVVDTLFLQPPPHLDRPEELVQIGLERTYPGIGTFTSSTHAYPLLGSLREGVEDLRVAAYYKTELSVGAGPEALQADAVLASPGYFDLLGAPTAAGRWIDDAEAAPGSGATVVVLGHAYWRRHHGGDPDVLGRTLRIAGARHTVVGVTPPGFSGVELAEPDLWLPISALDRLRSPGWHEQAGYMMFKLVGRVGEAAAQPATEEAATAAWMQMERQRRPSREAEGRALLRPIQQAGMRGVVLDRRTVLWLAGLAVLVLLVACANLANLQIARTLRRGRELAVRLSLGAGRGQLLRRSLFETGAVALLGAAAAALAVDWTGGLLRSVLLPGLPEPLPGERVRAAAFLALAAGAATLFTAVGPALQVRRRSLLEGLRTGGLEGSRRSSRLQAGLLVVQVALSLVLVVGAGLFLRSLANALGLDLGFDADRVLVAQVDLQGEGLTAGETAALYDEMRQRAEGFGAVEATALAAGTPIRHMYGLSVSVPGLDEMPRLKTGGPYAHAVSEGYFRTTGIRLLRGRGFEPGVHGADSPRVAVVNETFAELAWPGQDPLGRCLEVREPGCVQVVGVCEDPMLQRLREGDTMQVWLPLAQAPEHMSLGALLVRVPGDADELAPVLRSELQGLRPDLPYVSVRSLEEMLAPQLTSWRLGARICTVFGVLALVLAALGTYALLAQAVAQRTRELGVRIAVGADRARMIRLVLGRGLALAAVGAALGLALVVGGGRFVRPLLFRIEPLDPATVGTAMAVLTAAAVLASLLPALRASRVDPVTALRSE